MDLQVTEDEEEKEEEEEEEQDSNEEGDDRRGRTIISRQKLKPRSNLPPLLTPLSAVKEPLQLDWLGASFGLTLPLFNFWSRAGMNLLYLRQTPNPLTGEHSCIMVRALPNKSKFSDAWMPSYTVDARR